MQKQLNHYEFKNIQKNNHNDIIFVLDNLEHEENIGSAFRLADAFNICKIIIVCEKSIDVKKLQKTARSCEKYIPYSIHNNVVDALREIEELKYVPVNIEITSISKPLRDIDFAKYKKIALIVGNEKHGVSDEFLKYVPLSCHIEMYGNNSSMNVVASLAIATYKISEDLLLKKHWKMRI